MQRSNWMRPFMLRYMLRRRSYPTSHPASRIWRRSVPSDLCSQLSPRLLHGSTSTHWTRTSLPPGRTSTRISPHGTQPGYSAPTGMIQPGYVPQSPPASCDQSCYATNCAPPCPAQCCRRKKSLIHRRRKTRSITSGMNMCH